jgi:RNA polymerase sigma-70 factor (ECF subfamily)
MVMDEQDWLAQRFEEHRGRLRAVAYRMLGSAAEADDAVQETWVRLSRSQGQPDAGSIENLGGWLTTVCGRVCLNVLRSRTTLREEPLDAHVPDPIVSPDRELAPEDEVLLADAVGLALHAVLETLTPAERLAFVLHDMFGIPFDDIAPVVGRSPEATRQLASRARRRVRGVRTTPDGDLARQRQVVDAFFAAARAGDFEGLVAVLDPDVVLRADGGPGSPVTRLVRGAEAVAARARASAQPDSVLRPVLVNGAAGVVVIVGDEPFAVMAFTVAGGRIVEIDALADPDRLARLDLGAVAGNSG